MEKLDSDLLFRKAQALGDDIREMESIDVAKAFERTQQLIRKKRGRQMYDSLMRYAAFLTLPLLMISLTLGWTGSGRLLRRSHGCQRFCHPL